MDEVSGQKSEEAPRKGGVGRWIALAAVAIVLGVGAGLLYATQTGELKAPAAELAAQGPLKRFAVGRLAKLETPARARAVPAAVTFNDRDGKAMTLAAYRGKVVVVNLWATWCGPCVVEMPTLAAIARDYAGKDLIVAPISMDREAADAQSFIDVHEPLPLLHDPRFAMAAQFGVKGLPATLILDRQGREVARLTGESDWSSAEARALFDHLLAQR